MKESRALRLRRPGCCKVPTSGSTETNGLGMGEEGGQHEQRCYKAVGKGKTFQGKR